jgi:hypothetical protein
MDKRDTLPAPIVAIRGDIMTVLCPYCRELHKHSSTVRVPRVARCGAGEYLPTPWGEIKR